jgi:O-antigen/teichoic acid export membrane protein
VTSQAPEAASAEEPARPSLKARTIGATIWTFGGFGIQQVLRLGHNLVLTRLLRLPQIFGLMAVVQVFITGLEMLSDVGIVPAIIQSKRGDDPRLLNTAWTVQIFRGAAIGGCAAILAWPVSWFYQEPQLLWLLLVAGLSPVIRGFTSTRVATLNRHLNLGVLTRMELITQVISILVTVLAAWQLRSVWALLIGWLAGDLIRVILSHLMLPGKPNGLAWDPEAARELIKIGRWIILSTAVTFGVAQLDRLTLARLLPMKDLGIYTLALLFTNSVLMMGKTISGKVLFPMLSETNREDPHLFKSRLQKVRFVWCAPTAAALVLLAIGGSFLIKSLYPSPYHAAGWMLRILAAGSIMALINQSNGIMWPALGEFRIITLLMLIQLPILFASMILGHALFGLVGFVTGVALVELFVYPIQAFLIYRRHLWQPKFDFALLAASGSLIALGYWFV